MVRVGGERLVVGVVTEGTERANGLELSIRFPLAMATSPAAQIS